jgi:hypothetical protein
MTVFRPCSQAAAEQFDWEGAFFKEEIMPREVATTRNSGPETRLPTEQSVPQKSPPSSATRRNILRPVTLVPHRLTAAERHQRISDLAYRRAAMRGFVGGNELEDWLDAEREVDAGRY